MSERELSDIQQPFVYLSELARKTDRVLKQGESLVSSSEWETLPEYADEIRKIVAEFERVVPLLEVTHERILADPRGTGMFPRLATDEMLNVRTCQTSRRRPHQSGVCGREP
jgi:hypothetical protein